MMAAKRSPLTKSKDGVLRRTFRCEVRLTSEEESIVDNLLMDFRESSGDHDMTFSQYLSVLLIRRIQDEQREIQEAMDGEGLL